VLVDLKTKTVEEIYMKKFNLSAVTSTAAIVASLVTLSANAQVHNFVSNGDFEESTDISNWIDQGGTPSIITDGVLASQVLQVTDRTKSSSAAKYTMVRLQAGHTYNVTAKVKADAGKVGISVSFRGDELKSDGTPKDTTVAVGPAIDSDGVWLTFTGTIELPATFQPSENSKVWVKTDTNGVLANTYLDDLVVVDADPSAMLPPLPLAPSIITDESTYTNLDADNH